MDGSGRTSNSRTHWQPRQQATAPPIAVGFLRCGGVARPRPGIGSVARLARGPTAARSKTGHATHWKHSIPVAHRGPGHASPFPQRNQLDSVARFLSPTGEPWTGPRSTLRGLCVVAERSATCAVAQEREAQQPIPDNLSWRSFLRRRLSQMLGVCGALLVCTSRLRPFDNRKAWWYCTHITLIDAQG